MSRAPRFFTQEQISKRIKSGRGQGMGKDYQPWLTIQDVPSRGVSHRIYSHKTQRVHHLLSNLELYVFLILDWSSFVQDIREQFPLNLDDTKEICLEHGLRHPSIQGSEQVMTSDFLINTNDKKKPQFVIQVKPLKELIKERTIEKLEIERRYWEVKEIPWSIVTEQNIPTTARKNLEWLSPFITEHLEPDIWDSLHTISYYFLKKPGISIIKLCKEIDIQEKTTAGTTLQYLRTLIANRLIKFDIQQPFQKLKGSDLVFDLEVSYVANQ
ncbi:TnsA endonuclease N-terminal domain-containing protein [Acinetobacter pittii]|uniref:TnsA endonuclease N-terminal domain-containing protein n=1 Tax=Acinetobacter calcoaceticus/baumannii complex TaxID=909768 RepID=UPI001980E058|nr:TnsA endonuclease N-terminal domain-containing protein [Acinetobacter pittii]MBN6513982.1 heteromeric transposase endonuclease subunit TnsA [Acinetobacter pittii]